MNERRRHQRVEMVTPVKVYDIENDRTHDGIIQNVSVGGLGVRVPERVEVETAVALEFQLPPKLHWRHVQGHVVRVHRLGTEWVIGVAFYRLSRQVESEFASFVSISGTEPAGERR